MKCRGLKWLMLGGYDENIGGLHGTRWRSAGTTLRGCMLEECSENVGESRFKTLEGCIEKALGLT